ncbi:MAG: hypothetical protein ACYC37_12095 [Desulfobacteria bacterium]
MIPFAPLHNPGNLQGIEVALATCPGAPQVVVFDILVLVTRVVP